MVEALGDVAGHLDVLLLVLADGHEVRVVDQDVGGLEHRVGEEAVVTRLSRRHLVLVRVAALEEPHRRHRREHPGELGDLGDVRLAEQHRPLGIEAAGQVVEGDGVGVGPPGGAVAHAVHRVVIRDEQQHLVGFLQLHELAQRPEVVADVQEVAGGLHPRQDALAALRTRFGSAHVRPARSVST